MSPISKAKWQLTTGFRQLATDCRQLDTSKLPTSYRDSAAGAWRSGGAGPVFCAAEGFYADVAAEIEVVA